MNTINKEFKLPQFDSKIKFYFSLFFTSIKNYNVLVKTFGDDIDIFKQTSVFLNDYEIDDLKIAFSVINQNNDMINLKDNVILRLFNKDEIINYYNDYVRYNPYFSPDDEDDINSFNIYMLNQKVKEKKSLEFGSLYDLLDTFEDEEIINAVKNLDYSYKKTFILYFGMKGDKIFEINQDDPLINEILIKLYSYMLLKREDNDVPYIIKNELNKDSLEFTFFDYIRLMCNDNSITNAFIFEMLSKMDYNSQRYIKEVFGEKLDKKTRPKKEKDFKRAIDNLTLIIKINKEYRNKKTKAANEENKTKDPNKSKEKKETKNKKEAKEKPKEESKKQKINKENKKLEQKKVKTENNKTNKKEAKEKPKQKDTNDLRSLLKKGILKNEKVLTTTEKLIVSLYLAPKTIDQIADIMGYTKENVTNTLKKSIDKMNISLTKNTEKPKKQQKENNLKEIKKGQKQETPKVIEELVKENETNKKEKEEKEKEEKQENKKKEENKEKQTIKKSGKDAASLIDEFIKEHGKDEFLRRIDQLDSFSKNVLACYLGLYEKALSKEEIAKRYNKSVATIQSVIDAAAKNIIKESKIQKINLSDYLKENKISKDDFIKLLNKLSVGRQNLIKSYFGISTKEADLIYLSEKYKRSGESINKIVQDSLNYIANDIKKNSNNKEIDKLSKFLNVNKITKDQFNMALTLLSPMEIELVSMYFGLNRKEMSITQIALATKGNALDVKDNLTDALKKINSLSKKGNLNDNALNNAYKMLKLKIGNAYKFLLQDQNFMLYINSNPIISSMLSVVSNFNLEDASKMLMMPKQELVNNLKNISNMFDSYFLNASKTAFKSGFYDEEQKQKEESRKY